MSLSSGGDGVGNPPRYGVGNPPSISDTAMAESAASTTKPKKHARNMIGLTNRKKRLSRHKGGRDRKVSRFDYTSVVEQDGIRHGNNNAGGRKPKSPIKARVKARNTILENEKSGLIKDVNKWKKKFQRERKRLNVANFEKRDYRKQLKQQEAAFNKMVAAATTEAEIVLTQANNAMERARQAERDCEEKILKHKRSSAKALREERGRASKKRDTLTLKHLRELKKLRDAHTTTMVSMENGIAEIKKLSEEKLMKLEIELTKERVFWQTNLQQAEATLDRESLKVDKLKRQSRDRIQKVFDKAMKKERKLRQMLDDLRSTNFNLKNDVADAKGKHRGALCVSTYWRNKAEQRLRRAEEAEADNGMLKDKLVDAKKDNTVLQKELDRLNAIVEQQSKIIARYNETGGKHTLDMRKVRASGQGRGQRTWEYWVVQMICELLVAGVPPSAVPQSITIVYETIYDKTPDELPSLSFVRRCRTVIQVVGETIAAIKLAEAPEYGQLFYDATTRRHIPFQCVLVGLLGADMKLDVVCLSSSIFLEDETAETTAESILEKVCLEQYFASITQH